MKKVLKIIGGLIVAVIILVIVVSMFSLPSAPSKVSTSSQATKTDTKQKDDTPKVFNVGDTINYNGLNVTITKAEYTAPAEYGQPKNGKVLTLYIIAKNVSQSDKLMVDNTEFNLYDANENKFEQYYSYDETAISGTVDPGTSIQGKVYYDVPAAPNYKLIYTPSFSANADGTQHIKVNVKMQ